MYLERKIEADLNRWAKAPNRRPLLLRGARQVGKSTLIEQWGARSFEKILVINFEQYPKYKEAFKELEPQKILDVLSLLSNQSIQEGSHLLFLDEIQECPQAITALRYFFEQKPGLHVIGAGSSLEMALQSNAIKVPVGRIEYLYLYPFSFEEFLKALGENLLANHLAEVDFDHPPALPVHEKLLSLLTQFFFLGGMPAVVEEYTRTKDLLRCKQLQRDILTTYNQDFGKYHRLAKKECLEAVVNAMPSLIGNKLVYAKISADHTALELKKAIGLLEGVDILHRVFQSTARQSPLAAGKKEKFYKTIFLDIGLLQSMSGLGAEILNPEKIMDTHRGALAEQFVGQELLHLFRGENPRLFYWFREAKSSSAEVDYLWAYQGQIYPVEVKSGKSGTLKSLHLILQEYKLPRGIRFSQKPLQRTGSLVSIPLYLVSQLSRLLQI